jgi:hypothetical protein
MVNRRGFAQNFIRPVSTSLNITPPPRNPIHRDTGAARAASDGELFRPCSELDLPDQHVLEHDPPAASPKHYAAWAARAACDGEPLRLCSEFDSPGQHVLEHYPAPQDPKHYAA